MVTIISYYNFISHLLVGVLDPGDLRSTKTHERPEVPRHMNDDWGNLVISRFFFISRTFSAPDPGHKGPHRALYRALCRTLFLNIVPKVVPI